MPIIEFSCVKCGRKFDDLIMKKSEMNSVCCPECGSRKVKRLLSVFGFTSKGSAKGSSSSSCASCARSSCTGCKT